MNINKKIQDFFSRKRDSAAVYLFGSVLRLGVNNAEDVDVAVLYDDDKMPDEFQRIKEQQDLSDYLKKDVDLIILNNAPPILRMQVLKKGKLIVLKNRKAKNNFFVRTINEYFDLKQIRKPIEQKLAEFPILGWSRYSFGKDSQYTALPEAHKK